MTAHSTAIGPFVFDPDDPMPETVQQRHHTLVIAACDCFDLRNAASDADRVNFYQEAGDRFFMRSRALLTEWAS